MDRAQWLSRIKAEEAAGRAAVCSWIDHPAVREIMHRDGPVFADLLDLFCSPPLDQREISGLAMLAAGAVGRTIDPKTGKPVPGLPCETDAGDVVIVANPFLMRFPEGHIDQGLVSLVGDRLRAIVCTLEATGVPLDTRAPMNLIVLAQLLALPIPPDVTLSELVQNEDLNVLGPSGVRADLMGTEVSNHTLAVSEHNITLIRRGLHDEVGLPRIHAFVRQR